MPRFTRSMCKDAGITLPPNDRLLSLKGGTSLVYHSTEPNMVDVYTIESAKAQYWHYIDFGTYPIEVGSVQMYGWEYRNSLHKARNWTFPVFLSTVPFVEVGTYHKPVQVEGEVSSKRMCKYIKGMYDKHIQTRAFRDNSGNWLINLWNDLYDPDGASPECIQMAADFAMNGVDLTSTYPQHSYDAFAIWEGRMLWLDPYHDDIVITAVRSSANCPARGW